MHGEATLTEKPKLDWYKVAAEMGAIIFAVLLALWLEGWREDVERQEHADDFLMRIHAEVAQNYQELRQAIQENATNIEGLRLAIAENDLDLDRVGPFLNISGGSTISAAWQSAQMTQATSYMPVATVAQLSTVYDTQAYYANYLQSFFEQFADIVVEAQNETTVKPALQRMVLKMEIANDLARQTVRRYRQFLDIADPVASTARRESDGGGGEAATTPSG